MFDFPFPLFAKPIAEGTGKGVTAASKITDPAELEGVCLTLLETFRQPVLVETFLPGREFTVGIIGTGAAAFAPAVLEVHFLEKAEKEVYSYINKEEWHGRIEYRLAADPMARLAGKTALAAWRGLGCRDGGRIDLRADADGIPQFMEVNPLAGLRPGHSDLPILCELAGMPYRELIAGIMQLRTQACPERIMKVAVIHGEVAADAARDEIDVLTQVDYVSRGLAAIGHEPVALPVSLNLAELARTITALRPAIAFNLVETLTGRGSLIHIVPAVLDTLKLPYTGADAEAMMLTSNKILAKKWLRAAGLPTPPWVTPLGNGRESANRGSLARQIGLGARLRRTRRGFGHPRGEP